MTATTTSRSSPRGPWSQRSPNQVLPVPSATTSGYPAVRTPVPTSQHTSRLPKALSPHLPQPQRSTSPNYFEYVTDPNSNPPNSNAGIHAKKNWSPSPLGDQPSPADSQKHWPLESHSRLENFRRQSETNAFKLSHNSLSSFSSRSPSSAAEQPSTIENVPDKGGRRRAALSPRPHQSNSESSNASATVDPMDIDPTKDQPPSIKFTPDVDKYDEPRVQSPANMSSSDLSKLNRTQISYLDERHPRRSLPHNRVDRLQQSVQRSETLPSSISTDGPTMISPEDFVDLVKGHLPQDILLLDLRVNPQYSKSRIHEALNLCIPTTLLKRASFNVRRLADTFSKDNEKAKFAEWKGSKFIVVYDANSVQLKDAASTVNTLKKFTSEGYQGSTFIVRGGFDIVSKKFPEQIDNRPASEVNSTNTQKLSIDPPIAAPVAGGCMMPATQTAANPFFGSIRQNMDLIGGVGQLAVHIPSTFEGNAFVELPKWLEQVTSQNDNGKTVADRFLGIEKAEQQRMQKALSCNVTYGSPHPLSPQAVQIAGIEKGTKNRYKDMLPYDHTRVKLQNVPFGDCDYVNASHIRPQNSNKHYIASQAPVPDTFQDFWRVAWEQDVRVIVMLTAEFEGNQRKCHPYWLSGDYGPFKLKSLSERHQSLEKSKPNRSFTTPQNLDSKQRPELARRHTGSYTSHQSNQQNISHTPTSPLDPDSPHVIVRKITLQHANFPFEPLREITQLQYSSWPDFGAPAHPAHVLSLVEHCNSIIRCYQPSLSRGEMDDPAREGERQIMVHCSAGCGRTGTFCTVDSVIDMLKQQRRTRHQHQRESAMDLDANEQDSWTLHDDDDLVAKVVADFRLQRLSMVQTLRQFVLCYETVLEWIAGEMSEKHKGLGAADKDRRSWAG